MFPTLAIALITAKRWSGAGDEFDPDLTLLLEASKSVLSYRPFVVAAYWLATAATISRGLLWEATGEAKFLKPEELTPLIERLLALQRAADGDALIPIGWDVETLRGSLCGCQKIVDSPADFGIGLIVSPF